MEKLQLFSNKVSIANSKSNNYFDAEFVIGGFDANSNKDMVNRDTIENWLPTLLFTHLVGNIKPNNNGEYDFTGHEMKRIIIISDDGTMSEDCVLNTKGFGTCIKVEIKEFDNKEFIVATFRVFERYSNASNLIKQRIANGTLYSSWEIGIKSYHMNGDIRVIDDGEFLAHCVLGADVLPACKDAKLLNVASVNETQSQNLENILLQDMERNGELMKKDKTAVAQTDDIKDVVDMQNVDTETVTEPVATDNDVDNSTEPVDNQNATETISEPSTASLTDSDIYDMLNRQLRGKFGYCYIAYLFPIDQIALIKLDEKNQKSLDFVQVQYQIEDNKVEISDSKDVTLMIKPTDINTFATEMQTKLELANQSLDTATASIKELQDKVVEYEVYKTQVDKIQEEQAIAETKAKQNALASKLQSLCGLSEDDISQNETLKTAIAGLDETTIHSFIVENMLKNNQVVSTASDESIQTKADINTISTDEYNYDGSIMKDLF